MSQHKLEEYAWNKQLGKGTFGVAYQVNRLCDKKDLVIKVMFLEHLNARDRKNAFNEVHVLKQLRHTNIVGYVDAFEAEFHKRQSLCLVQEYCDGGNLLEAINRRAKRGEPMEEEKVLRIFSQTLLALDYMHSRGVVHRDIKSENIFLMADGTAKLGDLGLCRILGNTSFAQTVCGTPNYFAPELCRQEKYTHNADIWALGCVMYELMNFSRLFTAPETKELMYQISGWQGPPRLNECYSRSLRHLVRECLNPTSRHRYSSRTLLSKDPVRGYIEKTANVVPDTPRRAALRSQPPQQLYQQQFLQHHQQAQPQAHRQLPQQNPGFPPLPAPQPNSPAARPSPQRQAQPLPNAFLQHSQQGGAAAAQQPRIPAESAAASDLPLPVLRSPVPKQAWTVEQIVAAIHDVRKRHRGAEVQEKYEKAVEEGEWLGDNFEYDDAKNQFEEFWATNDAPAPAYSMTESEYAEFSEVTKDYDVNIRVVQEAAPVH